MSDDLRKLASDLSAAGRDVEKKVRPVLLKGALNIQRQLRAEMGQSRHFGQVSRAINFDVDGLAVEVGPTRGAPGSLANIAYFGTSRGGGTVPDPEGALLEEYPKFERFVKEVLGDI